jgi:DNA/RNA-binding protein KIN17
MRRRFGTKRVRANQVYQEYIADKSHLHMNATRWVTLTEFVKHLGRSGIARVDETEKGWFIAWIDSSPKALAKAVRTEIIINSLISHDSSYILLQEASLKKDRATTSDEQRERMLIAEQIERAAAEAESPPSNDDSPPVEEGLKRDEGAEKVVLSFSAKPAAPAADTAPSSTLSAGFKTSLKVNPLKANPLKRPNVFKSASGAGDSEKTNEKKRPAPMTAAERLILEDQERKRRRMDRDNR